MIKIEEKYIGIGNSCFIIAEAGVNHNGELEIAKKLIDSAAELGADAIKFQTFITEKVISSYAPMADYQKKNIGSESSQLEMVKKLELSFEEFTEIKEYCKHKGIIFLSSPFDFESVDFLENIGISAYKIGSGEITNIPFLSYVSSKGKPIILSTGMSSLAEVEQAMDIIKSEGNDKIILLHCTSNYPTNYNDVNLRAMETLKYAFKVPVGYSDHTEGIEISIAALAMGAVVIEKHFTLDKSMEGPDHKASLSPEELKKLITSIRNVEKAFGDGIKKITEAEKNVRSVARKSIVANKRIKQGDIIKLEDLTFKRPGSGIEPKMVDMIINKKAKVDISYDEIITWEMIE